MNQMATASIVAQYLENTYWVQVEEDEAEAMGISGSVCSIITVSSDGTSDQTDVYWSIDYDNFYFYDGDYNLVAAYGWNISSDMTQLQLTDSSTGESQIYTQASEEESEDIVSTLASLLGIG